MITHPHHTTRYTPIDIGNANITTITVGAIHCSRRWLIHWSINHRVDCNAMFSRSKHNTTSVCAHQVVRRVSNMTVNVLLLTCENISTSRYQQYTRRVCVGLSTHRTRQKVHNQYSYHSHRSWRQNRCQVDCINTITMADVRKRIVQWGFFDHSLGY